MRFYMNILTTYFPDRDPPYDVYYQQILEQIELAEELGWECFMFNEHPFPGLRWTHRQPGGDAQRGRGAHLENSFGDLHRNHPVAPSAALGGGLRHGGRDLGRQTGVRRRLRQYGTRLPGLWNFPRRKSPAHGRGQRGNLQSLVSGAV